MFNLDKEVCDNLDDYAKEKFIYKSKLVNSLIKEYLEKNHIKDTKDKQEE